MQVLRQLLECLHAIPQRKQRGDQWQKRDHESTVTTPRFVVFVVLLFIEVNSKAELYPRSFARNSLASGHGWCSKSRRNCGNGWNGSNSRQRVLPNNWLAAGEACKRVSIYPNTKRELQDTRPTSHVTHHKMYIPHSSRPNRVPVPHSLATCKMRCSIAACPAAFYPRATCALPLIPPKIFSYFFLYTVYRCDMERHFCWFEKQLTVHAPCTYCRKNPAWIVSAAR
jgi:hypothetical protein